MFKLHAVLTISEIYNPSETFTQYEIHIFKATLKFFRPPYFCFVFSTIFSQSILGFAKRKQCSNYTSILQYLKHTILLKLFHYITNIQFGLPSNFQRPVYLSFFFKVFALVNRYLTLQSARPVQTIPRFYKIRNIQSF